MCKNSYANQPGQNRFQYQYQIKSCQNPYPKSEISNPLTVPKTCSKPPIPACRIGNFEPAPKSNRVKRYVQKIPCRPTGSKPLPVPVPNQIKAYRHPFLIPTAHVSLIKPFFSLVDRLWDLSCLSCPGRLSCLCRLSCLSLLYPLLITTCP